MGAIFISYRRDDTEGQAGRLFEDLRREFGQDAVFMDVAAIEPGRDFRRVIDQQVAVCGVLLALVGRKWVDATDETGARRLDDPLDFVRLETASALRRDIPVVPVLVHGARMPRADQLPDELKEFAFRNAVELTHARWESDVQVLARALRPYAQAPAGADTLIGGSGGPRAGQARMTMVVAAAVVAALGGGLAWWQFGASSNPTEDAAPRFASTAVGGEPVKDAREASSAKPEPATPARVNLQGVWPAQGCDLIIDKDDGRNIAGTCVSSIEHRFVGRYVSADTVALTLTRIDLKTPCTLTDTGTIKVLSPDIIEFRQGGWKGCDPPIDTGPYVILLKRK